MDPEVFPHAGRKVVKGRSAMEMGMERSPGHLERPQGIAPARRPIGRVLVEGEFVTHHELERALETQKRTNEMLGEVLVRMGVLEPVDLAAALAVQGELASVKDALRAAAGVRMLLGELLVTAKRITPSQLDRALARQREAASGSGSCWSRRETSPPSRSPAASESRRSSWPRRSPPPFPWPPPPGPPPRKAPAAPRDPPLPARGSA
jgi:hypothetical protein